MAVASQGCGPCPYRRRHPEQTALYQVVQQHLETYLAIAGEDDWDAQRVPAYVERQFRRYLECGILAHGFARARCPDCGHDFLVAFSCKGCGLCPSCNARRMAETAAHLVDHVIPPLPVRQWVLSVPKRLRWYLEREPQAVTAVLHILLRVIEAQLRRSSGASSHARFGAVNFIHRFGASLNRHVHYHCCVINGVFETIEDAGEFPQSVRFLPAAELTPEAVAVIAEQVRVRVLRWFARSGLIEADDVREMLAWENSGFSLDAAVRVAAHDRAGPHSEQGAPAALLCPPAVRARAPGAARCRARRLSVAQTPAQSCHGAGAYCAGLYRSSRGADPATGHEKGTAEEKRGQRLILRSAGWPLYGPQPSRTSRCSGTAPMAGWSPRRS
jgi:hypothetical protein